MDNTLSMTDLSVITSLFGDIDITGEDMREDDADYAACLNVEDKITSLKKITERSFKKLPVFEVSFNGYGTSKDPYLYVMDRIAAKIVRPLLKSGHIDGIYEYILPQYRPEITHVEAKDTSPYYQFSSLCHAFGADDLACVSLPCKNGYKTHAYTVLSGKLPSSKHYGRWMGELVVDPGMYFAELIIFSEIEKYFISLRGLTEEERIENPVYAKLIRSLKMENYSGKNLYLYKRTDDFVKEFQAMVERYGYTVIKSVSNYRQIYYDTSEDASQKSKLIYTGHMWLMFLIANLSLPTEWLFMENSPCYHFIPTFKMIKDEYEIDKQSAVYLRNLSGDYASSYEEKKNIPLKTQKAMKESLFNRHFGTVEFDADVDLEKMNQIEKEFEALSAFFGQGKLSDYSIRFRRLGKHHAAGLYFPWHRCLCVDINSPDSLAHEYFHLIDYRHGKLSRKHSFEHIREQYAVLVSSMVEKNEALKKVWNGNTKYNKKYYLEPTEIFARCGEIYLTRIKGISNSLANPSSSTGFAYPTDENFLKIVEEYFDRVFTEIKVNKKEDAA